MNTEFGTTQLEAQPYLGIRATATKDKLGEIMGPLFGEVYGYIQRCGQEPTGMPFSIYHSMDGESVELECGMPVGSAAARHCPRPGWRTSHGTMATVTHMGPYEGLPRTWAALADWIKAQGLEAAAAPWEVYVTDPGAEPDQSKWRTEIYFPVR